MICLGKWGIRAKDGPPSGPLFVLYASSSYRELFFGLGDGRVVPWPRTVNGPVSGIDLEELARAAAGEILPGGIDIPIPVPYARASGPLQLDPGWIPADGNDDFSPLGKHSLDLSQSDYSGMRFGKASFREANLAGTKFAKATFDGGSFSKVDLTGADFSGAVLHATFEDCTGSNTSFKGAVLAKTRIQATLTNATFSGALGAADFAGSTLTRCDFTDAVIPGTSFSGATLRGGTYKAVLSLAAFPGATLDGVSFAGANLAGATFTGAQPATFSNDVDFGGAEVQQADFSNTTFTAGRVKASRPRFGTTAGTRTKLAGATIDTALLGNDWSYLDCAGATLQFDAGFGVGLKANFAILDRCNFSAKKLYKAEFKSASLHGAGFGNCDLDTAQFQQAVLGTSSSGITAADFTGSQLTLADFTDADLTGVSFASTNLQQAKFTNSLLMQTDFTNAYAPQVDFENIRDRQMQGVSFAGACLVNALFKETTISAASGKPPSFAGALLMGTQFKGASLADAVLTNAKLSKVAGKLEVTLKPLPGEVADTDELSYGATDLPPSITGSATKCPDGSSGPCTVPSLTTSVPTEWTQP